MNLSIIIVSWKVRGCLQNCLKSIRKNPPADSYEVIVVDNASGDGTAEFVKSNFPEVILIANEKNLGFAAANNQAILKAKAQYILLLNPDTIVQQGTLDTLIKFMDENNDAGACGPKLLNEDGTTQRSARRFPSFRGALNRHTILRNLRIYRGAYEKWLMKDFEHDRQCDVDQLMGAALMLRRSATGKTGMLDERFFMYYEEVDLCWRLKEAGWRIVFLPEAQITHLSGRSSSQIPADRRAMMLASMLKYFRKHRGNFRTSVFCFFFKPAVILDEFFRMISGQASFLFAYLTGNIRRREKSLKKARNSAKFLVSHTWQFLFKT